VVEVSGNDGEKIEIPKIDYIKLGFLFEGYEDDKVF
jgi:hypothetical protein